MLAAQAAGTPCWDQVDKLTGNNATGPRLHALGCGFLASSCLLQGSRSGIARGGAIVLVYMKESGPGWAHSSWQPIGVFAKTSAAPSMWPVYLHWSP
jgi:hypothetical protein